MGGLWLKNSDPQSLTGNAATGIGKSQMFTNKISGQ